MRSVPSAALACVPRSHSRNRAYVLGRSTELLGAHAKGAWLAWETHVRALDVGAFERSVSALVARHAALRTKIVPNGMP